MPQGMLKPSSFQGAAVLAGSLIVITIVLCLVLPLPQEWSLFPTSPGMEQEQDTYCRSRGEFGRYLPALPVGPSAALEQALADYERLHAHCLLSDHAGLHRPLDMMSNASSCKYLLYLEEHVGLGNHIISLASAFLYALLTGRVLLLDSRGHLPHLLCQPFSWLPPRSFPYTRLLSAAAADLSPSHPVPWIYLAHLDHDQSPLHQQFWTPALQDRLLSVPWLVWSSNQYLVPRFFSLPSLWPRLLALFPSHPSLTFSHLARYLLLPANLPWQHIVDAHAAHLSASNVTVGLQLRRQFAKPRGVFSRAALDRVMECLTTDIGVGTLPNDKQENGTTVAIMVASLQGRYYDEMKGALEKGPAALVTVHTLSKERRQKYTWDQALKAFVEMWVLSMCDELATSSWSTFGYVSRGLRGRPSWLLHLRADLMNADESAHCSLQQSPDPCNHFPFLTHNQSLLNTSLSMVKWGKQHLLPCIDEHGGIQLVDHN